MWVLLMLALAVAVSAECPRHCECKWRSGKESALCARAGLNAVPPRLDLTTQLLDLTENRIISLRDDAFSSAGLINLQRLYLALCNLKVIRQHAFRALVNLVELDLSGNRLESVPSHAFDSIPELRELRLGGNPIIRIEGEAFSSLSHLVRLNLSTCKISEIDLSGFKGLEGSLEYLDLSTNKLQVLHVAVLAPLRTLKGLELASNPWDCNCHLRPMRDWMIRKNVPATIVPDCALPPRLMSQPWDRLDLEDFACLPKVSVMSNNYKGVEGEDVTLVCEVIGMPAPRVRWLRSGRLLSNNTTTLNVNSGRAFTLRSEGQASNLTIKSADIQDSGFYTCSAENRAGKAEVVLNLIIEKKPENRGFGGKALMAGMAVSAVIVLSSCLIGLCAYEIRKKRQIGRWHEQMVTSNHNDNSYEKIEANLKTNEEAARAVISDINRKRGDYRNVPSHDPEEEYEVYNREELRDHRESFTSPHGSRWRRAEMEPATTRAGELTQDLHIPRLSEYNIRAEATPESMQNSKSAGILSGHVEILSENNRFNNHPRPYPRTRIIDRFDIDQSGSDSEKNYPDLIEMSALGSSSYSRSDIKHDPYYFYTIPRRKDGDSRSPLLSSRRNSSGGDSVLFFERSYEKSRHTTSGRRSNSFLDLSMGGTRIRRNPSLPTSPSREQLPVPSATPLLDLTGLRDYSRTGQPFEDFDFRASQLEKFLEEYRSLREQLSRMKETRENLQRTRAVENEELKSILKGKPSIAVTETSSSVALADAASPLALSPPEYKSQGSRPEWLSTLLYRN